MKDLPSYLYILECTLYFIYQIMDALDGIHARATGNSSPLGTLVDHGLDAYTCGALMLFNFKYMQMGCNFATLALIWGPHIVFYQTTVEE